MEKIEIYSTLAYIKKDDSYLFLYRNKKENDLNKNKYVGIGGKLEKGESYIACLKREVKEETNLDIKKYRYLGKIDFLNTKYPKERMYLFVILETEGEISSCNEGKLVWVNKEDINKLNLWEGDKIFLPYLESDKRFYLRLNYEGDTLVSYIGPIFKEKSNER